MNESLYEQYMRNVLGYQAMNNNTYDMYYDYEEPIKTVKLHRILAINRAEAEKVIKVSIVENRDLVLKYMTDEVVTEPKAVTVTYVTDAIVDAYDRLIKPAIVREIRSELKDKAEDQAIHIFGENLRNYLLQPPMKGKVVLGVDPAFRTGCKLACLDEFGNVMHIDVIYPHEPKNDKEGARVKLLNLIVLVLLDNFFVVLPSSIPMQTSLALPLFLRIVPFFYLLSNISILFYKNLR